MNKTLKHYMPSNVREILGSKPTYHANCMIASRKLDNKGKIVIEGVARPGKTARDRARNVCIGSVARKQRAREKSQIEQDRRKK